MSKDCEQKRLYRKQKRQEGAEVRMENEQKRLYRKQKRQTASSRGRTDPAVLSRLGRKAAEEAGN